MAGNVEDISKYVTAERHEHSEERRLGYERRAEKRVDDLELRHLQLRETVIGKNGDNGLSSNVKVLDLKVTHHSKVLWWLTTLLGSTIVGLASTFLLRFAP